MCRVSVVGQEIFELFVRALRTLVYAYICKLPSLEPCLEVLVCAGIVRKFQPSSVVEVPRHVVLRLVVRSELREQLVRVCDKRLQVILLVTQYDGVEVGVLYVFQHLHEGGKTLGAASPASAYLYVSVNGKHVLLSASLCDNLQFVGMLLVCIPKALDVFLCVNFCSIIQNKVRKRFICH